MVRIPMGLQELEVELVGYSGVFWGHVYTAADTPAAPYIVARSPILDVGSQHALALANTLIDGCVKTHERCIRIAEPDAPLPTRVVDCTDPNRPRLVTTAGKRGRYLALSYVWGEPQPHQTTKANIAAYSDGIDAALLPQTIRDAIYVTHALGVQYLWADSLCIIQDSGSAKRNEIGRMHQVYRYAYFTIIVACARRVSEGFLQARKAPPYDIPLPFICPTGSSTHSPYATNRKPAREVGQVYISPRWAPCGDAASKMPKWNCYNRAHEPISARGWCLQEYYMSPRALIFTSESLQFRCQLATQTVGGAFYNAEDERRLPDLLFCPPATPVAHGSEAWCEMYAQWGGVVEDYTGRAVTVPSDKLLACAAIAEAFARVLRSDYLAGLWRYTLLQDLLWCSDPDTSVVRIAHYRAPSWSWASVEGRVVAWGRHYYYKGTTTVAEVIRCEVTLQDRALPFGHVVGGCLILRAVLVPCYLQRREPDLVHDLMFKLPSSRPRASRDLVDEKVATAQENDTEVFWETGLRLIDSEEDAGIAVAWIMPLVRGHTPEMVHGLIVVRADSEGSPSERRTVYRRIGTFDLYCKWESFRREPLQEIEFI